MWRAVWNEVCPMGAQFDFIAVVGVGLVYSEMTDLISILCCTSLAAMMR